MGVESNLNCDVLLLAAGFGERLRPLTEHTPKPLIKIGSKTLIERNLELIERGGFKRVFINLHWHGQKIKEFVGNGSRWNLEVLYSEEDPILDTGGAIKQIESRLEAELLLTLNSDIIVGPDCDLPSFVAAHRQNLVAPAATMVVRTAADTKKFGAIGVLPSGEVASFVGTAYPRGQAGEKIVETVYTGIQILSRRVLSYMPKAGIPFGITRQTYPQMLQAGERIWTVQFNGYWNDVGTPDRLEQASKELAGIFPVP